MPALPPKYPPPPPKTIKQLQPHQPFPSGSRAVLSESHLLLVVVLGGDGGGSGGHLLVMVDGRRLRDVELSGRGGRHRLLRNGDHLHAGRLRRRRHRVGVHVLVAR